MLSLIKAAHYVLLTGERYIRQGGSPCLMFYADIRLRWPVHTEREKDNDNKWALQSSFAITARHPALVTSGGYHWRPVETCSPEDPAPTGGVHRSTSDLATRWNASYWNVFTKTTICQRAFPISVQRFSLWTNPRLLSYLKFSHSPSSNITRTWPWTVATILGSFLNPKLRQERSWCLLCTRWPLMIDEPHGVSTPRGTHYQFSYVFSQGDWMRHCPLCEIKASPPSQTICYIVCACTKYHIDDCDCEDHCSQSQSQLYSQEMGAEPILCDYCTVAQWK